MFLPISVKGYGNVPEIHRFTSGYMISLHYVGIIRPSPAAETRGTSDMSVNDVQVIEDHVDM